MSPNALFGPKKESWAPATVPCKVVGVRRLTAQSVLITLDPGSQRPRFVHKPGQKVSFCLALEGQTIYRSYNLVNDPVELPQVAVKHVAMGGGSQHFNDQIGEGDVLNVAPPTGNLYYKALDFKPRHFMLFAAGSGITPMLSIAQHALKARPDHRVTLIYANSSAREIMLVDELDELATSKRMVVFHVLSDGATGEDLSSGRLNPTKLHQLFDHFRIPSMEEVVFQSGPQALMSLVDEVAQGLPVPLKTTRYSFMEQPYGNPDEKQSKEETCTLRINMSESTRSLEGVSRQKTLLELADDEGLAMPANCRSGICHRCKARLISGHTRKTVKEDLGRPVLPGYILCCQNRPASDVIEIEFD